MEGDVGKRLLKSVRFSRATVDAGFTYLDMEPAFGAVPFLQAAGLLRLIKVVLVIPVGHQPKVSENQQDYQKNECVHDGGYLQKIDELCHTQTSLANDSA